MVFKDWVEDPDELEKRLLTITKNIREMIKNGNNISAKVSIEELKKGYSIELEITMHE